MDVPERDDDGPWVPGFPDDYYVKWRDGGVAPPHHEKWDEALQLAADFRTDADAAWSSGEGRGPFTLEYQVRLRKINPGWIDGYRIVIR
jgi:hypothetical protein